MKRRRLAFILSVAMILTGIPANGLAGIAAETALEATGPEEAAAAEAAYIEETTEAVSEDSVGEPVPETAAEEPVEESVPETAAEEPVEEPVPETQTVEPDDDSETAVVETEDPSSEDAELPGNTEAEGLTEAAAPDEPIVEDTESAEEQSAEKAAVLAETNYNDLYNGATPISDEPGVERTFDLVAGTNCFRIDPSSYSRNYRLVLDGGNSYKLYLYDDEEEDWYERSLKRSANEKNYYNIVSRRRYLLIVDSEESATLTVYFSQLDDSDEFEYVDYNNPVTLYAPSGAGYTYQWYDSEDKEISGETSYEYTTPAITSYTEFYCAITDNGFTIKKLYYVKLNSTFTVTRSPSDYIWINYGASTTLSVTATSTIGKDASITYQWYDEDEKPINGATGASFTTPNLTSDTYYYCNVTDEITRMYLEFDIYIIPTVTVTKSPSGNIWINYGTSTTLSVTASTSREGATITYRWYDEDDNLVGDGASFTTPNLTSDTGYSCRITDGTTPQWAYFYIYVKPAAASTLNFIIGSANAVKIPASGTNVWYRIVPAVTGKYTIYSSGSADPYVTLYDSDFAYVAYNNNGGENDNFSLSVTLVAGTPYYLKFGCYDGVSFSAYARLDHTHTPQLISQTTATATKHGSAQYRCTACGETYSAVLHNYVDKVTAAATVLTAGSRTHTCSVCGYGTTETIAKLTPTISVNVTSIPLKVKQSTTKVEVSMGAGDYIVSWKSNKPKIAAVNSKGKITGKKAGTAKITVTLKSGRTATITVKVQKAEVKTTKITNVSKKVTLKKGKKYVLSPTVTPITSLQKVTYVSANRKVATVTKKGVITAKKKGKVKITVKSGSKKKVITVTVK